MAKDKTPVTAAIRLLKQRKADFTQHLYNYEERGGTSVSARELEVDEHQVIKTLVVLKQHLWEQMQVILTQDRK